MNWDRLRAQRGFTLVEMLVSLAILAMMTAMLLNGLQSVAMFGARSVQKLDDDDEIAAGQRVLRDRIEQLRAVLNRFSQTPIIDAGGDESSFSFVGPPIASGEPDGLWRYRIQATPAGDLVLYTANILDDRYNFAERDLRGWRARKILDNVQTLRLTYFGPQRVGGGTGWQSTWQYRPQPPALVRIRVELRAGDHRHWPDLIVRPRATENTACTINALTGRCGGAS